jgi:hypothetical protein
MEDCVGQLYGYDLPVRKTWMELGTAQDICTTSLSIAAI